MIYFVLEIPYVDKKENVGLIISIKNEKEVRILYETKKGGIRTKVMSLNDIYTKKKGHIGREVVQRFIYTKSANNSKPKQTSGI